MDLKLVPIEEIIQELKARTETLVIAYTRQVDAGNPIYICDSAGPSFLTGLGLCRMLEQQIIINGTSNAEPIGQDNE